MQYMLVVLEVFEDIVDDNDEAFASALQTYMAVIVIHYHIP